MELVASILLVAGSLLAFLAAVGLIRFEDVFTRMHAATKPATLGLILILTGTALVLPPPNPLTKLILVMLLQFATAPVGAHLIGSAAYRMGAPLTPGTVVDEDAREIRPPGSLPPGPSS